MVHKLLLFAVAFILLGGCMHGLETVSTRVPSNIEKAGSNSPLFVHERDGNISPQTPPEIYVKRKNIAVKPTDSTNTTGSLFNAQHQRNYLITDGDPARLGKIITVEVASNRIAKTKKGDIGKKGANADKKAEATPGGKGAGKAAEKDDVEDALRKEFPNLDSNDPDLVLIKKIKMKVARNFENGDTELYYLRQSSTTEEGREISVKARVPYSKLVANAPITTEDLEEISWMETTPTETIERHSLGWEDEYTLRLSGFDEAKSREALSLEEKRQQLRNVQTSLDTKLKAFANEKREMAKQREKLFEQQKKDQDKINELEKTVADYKPTDEDADSSDAKPAPKNAKAATPKPATADTTASKGAKSNADSKKQ